MQTFFSWQADWWQQQAHRIPHLSIEDTEGVAAYAAKQASIRHLMAKRFDKLWREGWLMVKEGAGADNEILELEPSSSSFITNYPAPDR